MATPNSLSLKWYEVALVVAVIGGVSAVGLPLFLGIAGNAAVSSGEEKQEQLAEVQDMFMADEGEYAASSAAVASALEDRGFGDTAGELVAITTADDSWCAALSLPRGRLSNANVVIRSSGTPELFDTPAEAVAACEA